MRNFGLGNNRTSWDLMYFVLDEEISEWNQSTKEEACEDFPIVPRFSVGGTKCKAAKGPWHCRH